MQIEKILAEANIRKGDFVQRASISQQIKSSMRWQPNWEQLSDDKKQALEGVADEISMILNGDSDCKKTWYNVAGYAKMVGDSIIESLRANDDDILSID